MDFIMEKRLPTRNGGCTISEVECGVLGGQMICCCVTFWVYALDPSSPRRGKHPSDNLEQHLHILLSFDTEEF